VEMKRVYLTMDIGGELFAVAVDQTREILDSVTTTRIPNMPDYMTGVISVRGSAIPVVDMRLKLGLPIPEKIVHSTIVILEIPFSGGVNLVGAMVNEVREVLEVSPENVEPPPPMASGLSADFLYGMYQYGERFVMILKAESLFTEDEQAQMHELDKPSLGSGKLEAGFAEPVPSPEEPVSDTKDGSVELTKAVLLAEDKPGEVAAPDAVAPESVLAEPASAVKPKKKKPRRQTKSFDVQVKMKITREMKKAKITVEELAARIEMDKRTLKRLVENDNPNTTIATLKRIAKGIGCNWKDLVE